MADRKPRNEGGQAEHELHQGAAALPSLYHLHLLDEVSALFEKPDWAEIRAWINEKVRLNRIRQEPFVPMTVADLREGSDPALQPGDLVRTPILARGERFVVPHGCQIATSLHALGSVVLGAGVRVTGDLLACETIQWQGGAESFAQNLCAREIWIAAPGATVGGGIWCDRLHATGDEGVSLPAETTVRGVVVVAAPADGRAVIGADCRIGGLAVRGGAELRAGSQVSHLQAAGPVRLGMGSRAGYVEGAAVVAERGAQAGIIVSQGEVTLRRDVVVDSVRAQGDIFIDGDATVTGTLLLSTDGDFHIPEGPGWQSHRDHWFWLLPGNRLRPYRPGGERPAESGLIAVRSLTHRLWQQAEQLAGRG